VAEVKYAGTRADHFDGCLLVRFGQLHSRYDCRRPVAIPPSCYDIDIKDNLAVWLEELSEAAGSIVAGLRGYE
jgi:hypothetical protein